MNLNTYKHRNRYSTIVFVVILLTMISLLALIIYANFNNLKLLFTYKPPAPEVPVAEKTYNGVMYKIQKLEELSYEYDIEDYQKRVLNYIRSDRYNNLMWTAIGGVDEDFELYIQKNQGELELDKLKNVEIFEIPEMEDSVDFVHMMATMEANFNGVQEIADAAGWAGDLYQLVAEYKDTTLTGEDLLNAIKQAFNGDSSFGKYDVAADFDAVNIFNMYNKSEEKSLFLTIHSYYENTSVKQRVDDFKKNAFNSSLYQDLKQEVATRLNGNVAMMVLRNDLGVDLTTHAHIIDACVTTFVDYIY